MREAQAICRLCEARHLFIPNPETSAGDQGRSECWDCGFITTHQVTVVYDPDRYDLADPYGAGVELRARCIECGTQYYSHMHDTACYECGGVRFNQWIKPVEGVMA